MKTRVIFPTLSGYQTSWLRPDVFAALTLVAIAVPEQMATARLANMPATSGLVAFAAGSVLFALLGRSGQVSVGADSTIAPILAAGAAGMAAVGTPNYAYFVSFLALMVGTLVIAAGMLRLSWVSAFLSTPVITGVLCGIAIEILVRQLPPILGLPGGGTTLLGRLRAVAEQVSHVNVWSLAIAVGVFVTVVLAERIDRRIPGALLGLVVSTVLVAVFDLKSHHVAVLGTIGGGLPSLRIPPASWAAIGGLVGPALTVAFVCLAQTAATVRASSSGVPDARDFERDLVAIGAGSLVAGLTGSFAVNSSPPRSEIVASSGGKSQLSGLVAAAVVLAVALFATRLLADLPEATLGGILVFVATRLFRVRDLRAILRFDRMEFGLAMITLLAVSFFGIERGVIAAMVLSLADRTRRAARPHDAILGREPGTDHWVPLDVGHSTEQVPGVVVYLLYAPIWYGNADYVRMRIRQVVDATDQPIHAFVLDANGISDIDFTGARALGELTHELEQRGVRIAIARPSHIVHHDLKHSGLLESLGRDRLFATVEDAVEALSKESGAAKLAD